MVYVDELRVYPTRLRWKRWCHMVADTLEELHQMAEAIGLRREWFQDVPGRPHYDLLSTRRARAVKRGARQVSGRELVGVLRTKYGVRVG